MTQSPDRIYVNGTVYLGGVSPTRRCAVAVANGRISAIGDDSELRRIAGPGTELVDMAGGLLSPGFRDSHVHAVFGGLSMRDCSMHECVSADDCIAVISAFAEANPDREWLVGGGWNMDSFPGGTPTADLLTAATGDRPAYMIERGAHSAWLNHAALRAAGITRDSADPADGRIGRDEAGEPNGMVYEGAMGLAAALLPAKTANDYANGLLDAQQYLFSLGIVGWQDALIGAYGGFADPFDIYDQADRAGTLIADVVGALWWDREAGTEQIDHLISRRASASGNRFRASSVKLMLDGVVEAKTAAMVHPYHDGCGNELPDKGLSFIDREVLLDVVPRLDALGFQAHFHALGDQAVRDALDAIEAARVANGHLGLRHHLAHLQVIQLQDLPRFRAIDATATIQALWACAIPDRDALVLPQLGEQRRGLQWLYGSLYRAGAPLAAGSDWNVSSPNPILGIHVAANRKPPAELVGADVPAFLPDEALPLAALWEAYTAGSARVCGRDNSGRIGVGMSADLVQLDRDPFAADVREVHRARVVRTTIGDADVFTA